MKKLVLLVLSIALSLACTTSGKKKEPGWSLEKRKQCQEEIEKFVRNATPEAPKEFVRMTAADSCRQAELDEVAAKSGDKQ